MLYIVIIVKKYIIEIVKVHMRDIILMSMDVIQLGYGVLYAHIVIVITKNKNFMIILRKRELLIEQSILR